MPATCASKLRRSSLQPLLVGAAVALCFWARFALSAPDEALNLSFPQGKSSVAEAPAASGGQESAAAQAGAESSYVGTNQCFTCHRPQTDSWSNTRHVHAFTSLPERYRNDSECLKCHVTGFGKSSGYVAGADKDLAMVGCEACHGPGAQHIEAAQRFILAEPGEEGKIEKEIRATITKLPADEVCVACHIMQAHGEHPPFEAPSAEGERAEAVQCLPAVAVADRTTASAPRARFSARFSVKTCGGCHYDQYQHWRSGDHANLARMLPEQQLNNQDCQQCHPAAGMVAKMASMDEGADRTWVGVACESCHGPAVEHVVFNRRLISAPPLGAKMEEAARRSIRKGKPSSTCIQCHVHERHGEHPEFKKE